MGNTIRAVARWIFPIVVAVCWVMTSGYVLAQLASLHGLVVRQAAHGRATPADQPVAGQGGERADRLARLQDPPEAFAP